jgi:hypothetical protein
MTDTPKAMPSETSSDDADPSPRSIQDLRGKFFVVPGYQRGYRWGKEEVKALLNDLRDFLDNPARDRSSYYCLQPLVVKRQENRPEVSWEVVDGQQRLTTLSLILQFLTSESPFQISYETREGSAEFLKAPNEKAAGRYIDYHFIWQAHIAVRDWLAGEKRDPRQFADDISNTVRIIWYALAKTEKSVDVFTRLNAGKIPLTDAELIRALFLRSGQSRRLEMALEWDFMERALQSDDFWYFLQPAGSDRPNRIEIIFDLVAKVGKNARDHATFEYFYSRLGPQVQALESQEDRVETLWKAVKQMFEILDEWYQDRGLYHLTGYLIAQCGSIEQLLNLLKDSNTKTKFKSKLVTAIRDAVVKDEAVDGAIRKLSYKELGKTRRTLLLFNIATLLAQSASNMRFSFHQFKAEDWDVEHVHSVASDPPDKQQDQVNWLHEMRVYLQPASEVQTQIDQQLDSPSWDIDGFERLYDLILSNFAEDQAEGADNGIGNLVLLDQRTNRGYKNVPFPVKRKKILALDNEGQFVPLCTRNAFLKTYSHTIDTPMRWGVADRNAYQSEMIRTLERFFDGKLP